LARLTFRPVVMAVAVVVFVAAAAAGGALLYVRHRAPHGETAQNSARSTRTTPPAPADSSPVQGTPSPTQSTQSTQSPQSTPSASPSTSSDSEVMIDPSISQDPDASSVAAFLSQYFAAINTRDYQSYLALLSPQLQQGMTQAQFDKGYRSTSDSDETLVDISTASDGDLNAEVTFTSHQNPADSPDQTESCTSWDISLFLAQGGSGYVIDPAPSDYRASYQPC
jgi:hypothetical protein